MKKILNKKSLIVSIMLTIFSLIGLVGCTNKKDEPIIYYKTPTDKIYESTDAIFNNGFGTTNNGYDKYSEEVERLISVKPEQRMLDFADIEYYNFIHFGMNTFTGREWGTGKTSPKKFNPKQLDTDQWCETLKASGSKGIILTAKHHDGFCLWPSDYTTYDIASSNYKNGKGDIVRELSNSCRKYNLKFGVYLSPWDMHESSYGKDGYNDFFVNQLTELLTDYGDIFSVWFDGARSKEAEKIDFQYDWNRYYSVIRKLQPNAVITVTGPDVRWVGNEAGVARDSEWNVVSQGNEANPNFQTDAADGEELKGVKYDARDTGSRELLQKYKDLVWYPAEVDVSLRSGWFYHKNQKPKELDHLLKIYYNSVGGNSSLLLNIPPDKNGLIDKRDVSRLTELGNAVKSATQKPIIYSPEVKTSSTAAPRTPDNLKYILNDFYDLKYNYDNQGNLINNESYMLENDEYILDLNFDKQRRVGRIDIREDQRYSQRIEKYDIYAKTSDGKWRLVSENTNVGNRRSVLIDPSYNLSTDCIRIVIKQSRSNPVIRSINIFEY